jgi:microcystin-dependent protein
MPRPTLNNGDVWDEATANASIRPQITGLDESGHAALIRDENMDDDPDHLLSRFYGFYNRIRLTQATGLTLAYSGAPILLPNGTLFSLSPGTIALPDNSTVFVYVDGAGAVVQAAALPAEWIPLAIVTTAAGAIASLIDLRDKLVDQVRVRTLPTQAAPWSPGDIKPSMRTTTEIGWLLCDGRSLLVADYPGLFAAIGYSYGGSGVNFSLPDLRGRCLVGSGQAPGLSNRAIGQRGGAETVTLNLSQIPSHGHGVNDAGHSHGIIDTGHSHGISDPGHSHGTTDPGHEHTMRPSARAAALNNTNPDGDGAELSVQGQGNFLRAERSTTGVGVSAAASSVSVQAAAANIGVQAAAAAVTIAANGGGGSHENMQPWIAGNWFIKL